MDRSAEVISYYYYSSQDSNGRCISIWNGVRSSVNVGGDPSLNFSAKFKCFKITFKARNGIISGVFSDYDE